MKKYIIVKNNQVVRYTDDAYEATWSSAEIALKPSVDEVMYVRVNLPKDVPHVVPVVVSAP